MNAVKIASTLALSALTVFGMCANAEAAPQKKIRASSGYSSGYSVTGYPAPRSTASNAYAQTAPARRPTPRDAEVQSVKENYWNRTDDGEVEVVQNRNYAKKNRISLQIGAGTVATDPFLDVKAVHGAIGFHFSEQLGLSLVGRKYIVNDSSYMTELNSGLVTGTPSSANVNKPNSYIGGELEWSPIYGKISLSGSKIVHYDVHFLLGGGMTDTDNGKLFTPSIGLGPQFYLGNSVALRLDYRLSHYKEEVPEKVLVTRRIAGQRDNYSHSFTLGLVLFVL